MILVTQGGLASGCPRDANAIQNTYDKILTNQTGLVGCCSKTGGFCKSETPDCLESTFSNAKKKCSDSGRRLCTKKELASNICCTTGCGFDTKPVWYTKGKKYFSKFKNILLKLLSK